MNKTTLFSLLFCFLLSNVVFADNYVEPVSPFDEIILSGNIDVLLVEGTEESVEVRNKEEKISISVSGGVLKVKRKKPLKIKEYKQDPIQVLINYKVVRRVKASSGSSVTHRSVISGDQLVLDFNSGAHGAFDVDLGNLEVKVSEGAQLKVQGTTVSQNSKVATGAGFSAYRLDCERAYVKSSTGAEAKIVATELLEAKASTGGDINYKGNPRKVKIKDNLGGNVNEY